MRLVFALLLFANIAWFAWSRWVAAPSAVVVATSAPANGSKLQLAREAAPAKADRRPAPQSANHCLSLGPFTDLTDAARASTVLRENRLDPRQRAGEGVVWKGYWLTLAGVADRSAANELIERLRGSGIADAYAMPGDGREVTISLGLFSEQERALRRFDDVKAMGLAPRIVDRERTGTVYWIDVDVEPPAELPDAARLHGEGGRILRLEVKPCEA
jgi:cell division septation protein DedD